MDVSRLMILLKEAWSRVGDEGVGVMGDFIGKPFTATTMSELNYLVNAPLDSINRELREELCKYTASDRGSLSKWVLNGKKGRRASKISVREEC